MSPNLLHVDTRPVGPHASEVRQHDSKNSKWSAFVWQGPEPAESDDPVA